MSNGTITGILNRASHGDHEAASELLPLVYRELRQTGGDFRARGLGDISLLTKYRVVQEHWRGGSFNVAAVGGLEMHATGQVTAVVKLPYWWSFPVAVSCLTLLAIVCLYTSWRDLRQLGK